MLRTSMAKMATYIGTKLGDEATQKWISGKRIIPPEPARSQAILDMHAARVRATKDRIENKLRGRSAEKLEIEAKIQVAPADCGLLKEMRGVHGGQDDLILSAKLIRIAPETSSF
jgi:hypothetical protein